MALKHAHLEFQVVQKERAAAELGFILRQQVSSPGGYIFRGPARSALPKDF
jgi:hypothetical protein